MEKQKICIIGGSLTGLTTAICLSELGCEIDLITGNLEKNLKSQRTIAVSENNLDFLNDLKISPLFKKEIWACNKMKLYTESVKGKFSEIFELNQENKNEKIFYIMENSKIIKIMKNKIEKIKSISVIKNKKASSIYTSGLLKSVKIDNKSSKYNLVIICSGHRSDLINNIFNDKIIKNSYKECAITVALKHSSFNNNVARQIFLDDAIFALLPISKNKTSVVWSIKNSLKDKNDIFLKNKIKKYASNYLKKIKFISNIEKNDLNLIVRNKYYSDRILLFGDALHLMHPFIGQCFNMTLRDLKSLKKIFKNKINLGIDFGSSDILSEFSYEAKPRNFTFSIGADILKNALSLKETRNNIFKIINKSNLAKKIIFDIANKGLRF